MEKVSCKYQKNRPLRDKRRRSGQILIDVFKSTFGFLFSRPCQGGGGLDERMDGHRRSWPSQAGVVYWSEGLSGSGSGRLLARYFARMLEVYCGESEDMKHV